MAEAKFQGVYTNPRFMHATSSIVGCLAHVQDTVGKVWEGVLSTFSVDFTICLEMAVQIDSKTTGKQSFGSNIGCLYASVSNDVQVKEQLMLDLKDIVKISVLDADLSYATRDSSLLVTDAEISGYDSSKMGPESRKFEDWQADDDESINEANHVLGSLEETTKLGNQNGGWNATEMFRYNEQVHKVTTTYDEKMTIYTVPLPQHNTPEWRQKQEDAALIAKQIENNTKSQDRYSKEDGDEEEKYSAVRRPIPQPAPQQQQQQQQQQHHQPQHQPQPQSQSNKQQQSSQQPQAAAQKQHQSPQQHTQQHYQPHNPNRIERRPPNKRREESDPPKNFSQNLSMSNTANAPSYASKSSLNNLISASSNSAVISANKNTSDPPSHLHHQQQQHKQEQQTQKMQSQLQSNQMHAQQHIRTQQHHPPNRIERRPVFKQHREESDRLDKLRNFGQNYTLVNSKPPSTIPTSVSTGTNPIITVSKAATPVSQSSTSAASSAVTATTAAPSTSAVATAFAPTSTAAIIATTATVASTTASAATTTAKTLASAPAPSASDSSPTEVSMSNQTNVSSTATAAASEHPKDPQTELARKSKLNPNAKEFVYKPRSPMTTSVISVPMTSHDQSVNNPNHNPLVLGNGAMDPSQANPVQQAHHSYQRMNMVTSLPHQQHHHTTFMPNHVPAHFAGGIYVPAPMTHFAQPIPQTRFVRGNQGNYHHQDHQNHANVRGDYSQSQVAAATGQPFVAGPPHHMGPYAPTPQSMIYGVSPSVYPTVVQPVIPPHMQVVPTSYDGTYYMQQS